MKQIWWFSIVCIGLLPHALTAQDDRVWEGSPEIAISGFLDVFYVYDFGRQEGNSRQPFLFNHNRHNEFNLNLGYLKWEANHDKYRANLALQAGTYPNDNYSQEPGVLKAVLEANVGLALNAENTLWLDMGILPSHIGFESAVSVENSTLTRSLLAENSPYFMAGAKLTFQPNRKWEASLMVLNGWQRIQRLPGNSLPGFGTQLAYKANDSAVFNWSTFVGTDDPDSTRRMRIFNNFYGKFSLSDKIFVTLGFDIGQQQSSKRSSTWETWMSPVVIVQVRIDKYWNSSLRAEYYADRTGIIVFVESPNGFQVGGFSWNIDFSPTQNLKLRWEARWLGSTDEVFETGSGLARQSLFVGTSLAFRFKEVF